MGAGHFVLFFKGSVLKYNTERVVNQVCEMGIKYLLSMLHQPLSLQPQSNDILPVIS